LVNFSVIVEISAVCVLITASAVSTLPVIVLILSIFLLICSKLFAILSALVEISVEDFLIEPQSVSVLVVVAVLSPITSLIEVISRIFVLIRPLASLNLFSVNALFSIKLASIVSQIDLVEDEPRLPIVLLIPSITLLLASMRFLASVNLFSVRVMLLAKLSSIVSQIVLVEDES
jgi:hypothetical protein